MISIRTIIKTFIFIILVSCSTNKFTMIHDSNTIYTDYLIRTQKFHFSIQDTLLETNICVRPDGQFNFIDSVDAYAKKWTTVGSIKKDNAIINFKEKLVPKNQDTIKLISYFPLLIIHDNSIINHYDNGNDWDFGFSYEMHYSNILANLNEPLIYKSNTVNEIRVILSVYNYGIHSYRPVTYSSIRLKIESNEGIIFYAKGQYDSLANFNITKMDSSVIKERDLTKVKELIKDTDFEKEYYFAQVGIDYASPYLIEIKQNDNYYVFERSYAFNEYTDDKRTNQIALRLIRLKSKYID